MVTLRVILDFSVPLSIVPKMPIIEDDVFNVDLLDHYASD